MKLDRAVFPTVVSILTYGNKVYYVTTPGYVCYALYRMKEETES